MILCWAKHIAVLGRMRPAGRGLDSPGFQGIVSIDLFYDGFEECRQVKKISQIKIVKFGDNFLILSTLQLSMRNETYIQDLSEKSHQIKDYMLPIKIDVGLSEDIEDKLGGQGY